MPGPYGQAMLTEVRNGRFPNEMLTFPRIPAEDRWGGSSPNSAGSGCRQSGQSSHLGEVW
jgi:hypothetical protein